jgi:hypothetical protein
MSSATSTTGSGSEGVLQQIMDGTILGTKPMNIIVPTILAFLTSTNFLFSFTDEMPYVQMIPWNNQSAVQVAKHTAVFFAAWIILRKMFPEYYTTNGY